MTRKSHAILAGLSALVFFAALGCEGPKSPQPMVVVPPPAAAGAAEKSPPVYQYKHEVRIGGTDAQTLDAIRAEYVLAVGRVGDTSETGTGFGDSEIASPVAQVTVGAAPETAGKSEVVVGVDDSLSQQKLRPQPAPRGFDDAARSRLVSLLMDAGCFTVVERENINDIIREIKFDESGWAARNQDALARGELQAVKYIVAGNLELNPAALEEKEPTPDDWTGTASFPEQTHKKDLCIYRLRMYSTRTGVIAAVGDGYGPTAAEAMQDAVNKLASQAIRRHKSAGK